MIILCTGTRAGADVLQLYLTDGPDGKRMRLLAFERVELGPGEIRTITLKAEPKLLAKFDAIENKWRIVSGTHKIAIGRSADDLVLRSEVKLPAQLFGR